MFRRTPLATFGFSIFAALCAWPVAGQADESVLLFQPLSAPAPTGLLLKKGDRLAICGDSITQQKMYSRIIETYLTVCVPDLEITVRQYGWSGERASGFLKRMNNDCLRFSPTIATTCYGMNDCEITWGAAARTYSAEELAKGVNLADDFPVNPFSDAFKKVDEAVAAKQTYEQKEIRI